VLAIIQVTARTIQFVAYERFRKRMFNGVLDDRFTKSNHLAQLSSRQFIARLLLCVKYIDRSIRNKKHGEK
jgi:hypothetical protein